jgi:hypothetical protein
MIYYRLIKKMIYYSLENFILIPTKKGNMKEKEHKVSLASKEIIL